METESQDSFFADLVLMDDFVVLLEGTTPPACPTVSALLTIDCKLFAFIEIGNNSESLN